MEILTQRTRTSPRAVKLLFAPFLPLIVTLISCLDGPAAAKSKSDDWVWRNPLPTGNPLYSVVRAKNQFVAVGPYGTIVTSRDGQRWEQANSGSGGNLWSVAWGNDRFVAVGDATVLTSKDGSKWEPGNVQPINALGSVAFGNGVFVTVGGLGTIYASVNGTDWKWANDSGDFSDLICVTYGAGLFVAVGANGILISSDGAHWTHATGDMPGILGSVIYSGDRFIAMGTDALVSSSDGLKWSLIDNPYVLTRILYANGLFVGETWDGTTLVSPDATTWVPLAVDWGIDGLAWGDGVFVAVGGVFIVTSSDGVTWSHASSGAATTLGRVIYAKDQFVVLGTEGVVLSSPDAKKWTAHDVTTGLSDIAYGNGTFVAVGGSSWVGNGYMPIVVKSQDLDHWTNVATLPVNFPYAPSLYRVTFGAGQFVAAGDNGMIVTSPDGVNWKPRSSGIGSTFYCMTYGGTGEYVGFAESLYENGVFRTPFVRSRDGVNWAQDRLSSDSGIIDVCWGQRKYVAVGEWGSILTSNDATNWQAQASPTDTWLFGVAYGKGQFVAAGGHQILSSTDGVTWSVQAVNSANGVGPVAFGRNSFVTVGSYGTILESPSSKSSGGGN